MVTYPDITAGLLVGGRGRRMGGADKASLTLSGGQTFAEHLVGTLRTLVGEIVLLGRAEQSYAATGCVLLPDRIPDAGPLAGLESLLEGRSAWCLLLACDLPHFGAAALQQLADARTPDVSAVVLRDASGLHPTAALYHPKTLTVVKRLLGAGRFRLQGVLEDVAWTAVQVTPDVAPQLFNVNVPEQLPVGSRWPTKISS